jgi:formate dehydrogenase
MSKVVCVLYDDPVDGYPTSYVRDDLPKLTHYPGGQTLPTPKSIDFVPGHLLGSVSGELGLRKFLESQGHRFVVTSDKDGADSLFERELPDAEIVSLARTRGGKRPASLARSINQSGCG